MKLTVQVVVHADDQTEPVVREFGGYITANAGCIPNYGGAATAPGRPSPSRSSSPRSTNRQHQAT
jgi:hypothetical protein